MSTFLRFLVLVVVLNVLRYYPLGWLEQVVIFPGLFGAMTSSAEYFASEFTTFLWVTSYFYNFVMWLVVVWVYHICRPILSGHEIVRSLKIFGLMFVFFASVSFIYMNHYAHPNDFYVWNVLDAALAYAFVGLANGLLYPLLMQTNRQSADA